MTDQTRFRRKVVILENRVMMSGIPERVDHISTNPTDGGSHHAPHTHIDPLGFEERRDTEAESRGIGSDMTHAHEVIAVGISFRSTKLLSSGGPLFTQSILAITTKDSREQPGHLTPPLPTTTHTLGSFSSGREPAI